MTYAFSFLGFGAWGATLAIHLARHGAADITAWEHFDQLRDHIRQNNWHPSLGENAQIPETIKIADRIADLPVGPKSILVVAVASAYVLPAIKKIAGRAKPYACLITCKGLEPASLRTISHVVREVLKLQKSRVFVLGGPTIAKELLAGAPTIAVLAGPGGARRNLLRDLLSHGNLTIQTTRDIHSVEVAAAMKNIYGIGYGILDGLGASANTKSFYLIRAIEEMTSAAVHVGGSKKTVHGPAGLGDLLTTGLSANSRNSRLGRLLSQGKSLKECRREIGMVTEGVDACMEFERLADKLGLKLKLARCIKNTLTSPTQAGKLLLCLK